jgi:hypothetical protein
MAKSLRSKIKRSFRTLRRNTVQQTQWFKDGEAKQQEAMQEIINAPKPPPPSNDIPANDTTAPSDSMDIEQAGDQDLPPLTTNNPGKLLKKLRKRRVAKEHATKVHKVPVKKKVSALAGPNQFHKSKGKKKKRR